MKKTQILHIIKDDKFFDEISERYDNISELSNIYILIVEEKNYKFKYIKKTLKVNLCTSKSEVIKNISNEIYDVILFHSLHFFSSFYMFEYIKPKVKIVWWSWGYETYFPTYSVPAIIDIPLYKPLTKRINYELEGSDTLLYRIKYVIDFLFRKRKRKNIIKKIISRIDYLIPVLEFEHNYISNNYPSFHAKMLYHPVNDQHTSFHGLPLGNNIVIGNSSSDTNNHLDIWQQINSLSIEERSFYLPVSYGSMPYKEVLKQKITSSKNDVIFLEDFMEINKYFSIIKSCSFAIFGVMRQQAIGNIYYCLANGIKVFLYEDSIPYLQLKKNGFIIFTINDELNEKELNIPLTLEESLHNYRLIFNIRRDRMAYFNSFLKELQHVNNPIIHK